MPASKVRYEIDPHNRLIVKGSAKKARLPRFRKTIDGRFRINEKNLLTYHVKTPVPKDLNIPHQIKFGGKWSLTDKHDIRLTLDKWGRETFGDKLTLRGDIIDVRKNALLFAVTTKKKSGIRSTYVLKLRGAWQADRNNRIIFSARKEKGRCDILTLWGAWDIGRDRRIIYRHEKARLIRKTKKTRTLTFRGRWKINDKARLSYVIGRNSDSVLNFRTGLGIFKADYIKYEVGIRLSHRARPVKRTLTIFGKWNIRRNAGLVFSADKAQGVTVEFKISKKLLKGRGEAFLRLLKSKREKAISAGAAYKW